LRVYAAVPVKELSSAKSRLMRVVDDEARVELALAMLRDVLSALRGSRRLSSVLVVSSDPRVLEEAVKAGARPVDEGRPRGVNEALKLALKICLEEGADAMLVVPSDLPLLTEGCVSKLLDLLGPPPSMVISPSRDRSGTNALLLSPPNAIGFSFGQGSFKRHLSMARGRGMDVVSYEAPELSLDVDDARDLRALMASASRGHTAELLASLKAEGRLSRLL
jgi:2-phospho-L-lactate guanylyltransferase